LRVGALALVVIVSAGCAIGPEDYPASSPTTIEPILVSRMDLRPTVSMDAQVTASGVFAVLAPEAGVVSDLVTGGAPLKMGDTVALVDGVAVITPVDGVVVGPLTDTGQVVPINLPLVAVRYAGFALSGTPTLWAQGLLFQPDVVARGQVTDSQGPMSCAALVPSVSSEVLPINPQSTETWPDSPIGVGSGSSLSVEWMCLLPKDAIASSGQGGIVVATGTVAKQVIAVPVMAVAGRVGAGEVTLVTGEASQLVNVSLGRTDGSFVEVTAGLAVGDLISPIAPDLVAKGPR